MTGFRYTPILGACAVIVLCAGSACREGTAAKGAEQKCAWTVVGSHDATASDSTVAKPLDLLVDPEPTNRVSSPDGLIAAVEIDSLHHPQIFLENPATGMRRHLGAGSRPKWSPDGSRIACTVWKSVERPWSLSIIDVRSGRRREPEIGCLAAEMEWSPDGQWLAVGGTLYRRPVTVLCVVNVSRGESRMLDTLPVFTDYDDLDWSPDSRAVVATRVTAVTSDEEPTASDLWLFEPDGMRCQLTTTNTAIERRPRWIGATTIVYLAQERAMPGDTERLRVLTVKRAGPQGNN